MCRPGGGLAGPSLEGEETREVWDQGCASMHVYFLFRGYPFLDGFNRQSCPSVFFWGGGVDSSCVRQTHMSKTMSISFGEQTSPFRQMFILLPEFLDIYSFLRPC